MSLQDYIQTIPRQEKNLLASIALLYSIGLVWFLRLKEIFIHWDYIASIYLGMSLDLLILGLASLFCILTFLYSRNRFNRSLSLLALLLPVIGIIITLLSQQYYSPLKIIKEIESPQKTMQAIIYFRGETLSRDDMIIAVKQPNRFFPKALYISEAETDLDIQWISNHKFTVTTSYGFPLCTLDINAPTQILSH